MTAFPYTDEQVKAFADVIGDLSSAALRDLRNLHAAGISVTFPEPRYFVGVGDSFAHIHDRRDDCRAVVSFVLDRHPDARCAAQAEADRLNAEVQP